MQLVLDVAELVHDRRVLREEVRRLLQHNTRAVGQSRQRLLCSVCVSGRMRETRMWVGSKRRGGARGGGIGESISRSERVLREEVQRLLQYHTRAVGQGRRRLLCGVQVGGSGWGTGGGN